MKTSTIRTGRGNETSKKRNSNIRKIEDDARTNGQRKACNKKGNIN